MIRENIVPNPLIADVDNTAEFEREYPTLSKEFKKIQEQQYKLFAVKMLSYGLDNISVGSKLETENEKHLSITSIWIRCMDKIQRLKNLVIYKRNNPLKDEPTIDAWKDLSVYGIIAQLVSNGKWKR